jgi:hypothetical protein
MTTRNENSIIKWRGSDRSRLKRGGPMNKNLLICIIGLLFFSVGCMSTNTYLQPTSACKPLSAFDTLVISPFNGDAAFVEEDRYRGIPHDIAVATTDELKDLAEDGHLFRKVIQSSDCPKHAVKIDGKIYSLIHHRGFHAGVRGQIINCQTGETLYKFNNDDEQDSDSYKLPRQIAEKLTDGIKAKLTCGNQK